MQEGIGNEKLEMRNEKLEIGWVAQTLLYNRRA